MSGASLAFEAGSASAAASRPTSRRGTRRARRRGLLGLGAGDPAPLLRAAVLFAGDDVLGDVDEAPGQVARVGGSEGRVREALAGAVGGDEVLEDGHALAEVAPHGDVDDPARRVGHEAAHRAELADVALVPAGAGVGHHPERRRPRAGPPSSRPRAVGGPLPELDDLLVALVLGDEAALELLVDVADLRRRRPRGDSALSGGIAMSHRPIVMPPRVAYSKPTLLMPSTRWAVSSGPSSR